MTDALPLAVRLVAARSLRGLSCGQLAEAAGVTPSMLSSYEAGRVVPSIGGLVRLADALEVNADFLLGRSDEPLAAGERTDAILERLGTLDAAEMKTIDDLLSTWSARRRPTPKREPARVVVPEPRWAAAEGMIRDRIRRAKGLPENN